MEISHHVELAAEIVSAFVSNNSVPRSELPALIEAVHAAIEALAGRAAMVAVIEPAAPAVSIRKSLTPDYLICLEDGKRFKSLRRHLATLGLTPEQYREKWSLPSTYPMVAPNYAAQRSALAKTIGLGQLRAKSVADPSGLPEPVSLVESPVAAAPSESVEAIEPAAPEPTTAAKGKAEPKSKAPLAPPAGPAKRNPGRPRKTES